MESRDIACQRALADEHGATYCGAHGYKHATTCAQEDAYTAAVARAAVAPRLARLREAAAGHGLRVEEHDGTHLTTPDFWECACDTAYLQPRSRTSCVLCGATSAEWPDAALDEVLRDLYAVHVE